MKKKLIHQKYKKMLTSSKPDNMINVSKNRFFMSCLNEKNSFTG